MWLFPVAFLGSGLIPLVARDPRSFLLVVAPLFLFCYYMASRPVRERAMTAGQGMVLIVVAPFIIWILSIATLFGATVLYFAFVG
jgi:hypothetical protein